MQAESDFAIRLAEADGGDLRNAIRENHIPLLWLPKVKQRISRNL